MQHMLSFSAACAWGIACCRVTQRTQQGDALFTVLCQLDVICHTCQEMSMEVAKPRRDGVWEGVTGEAVNEGTQGLVKQWCSPADGTL